MSANEPEGFAAMPTTEEPEQVSPVSSPKPWQKPRPKASADTPTPGEEFLHSLPSSLTAHRGAAPRKRKPDADAEQDIDTAKIFRTCVPKRASSGSFSDLAAPSKEQQHPARESNHRRRRIAPPAHLREPTTQTTRCDDGHLVQHAGCDLKLCQQAGKEAARVARRRNTKAHRLLARAEDAMQKAHEDQALQQLLSDPCSS